jgi:hypothetical protein
VTLWLKRRNEKEKYRTEETFQIQGAGEAGEKSLHP